MWIGPRILIMNRLCFQLTSESFTMNFSKPVFLTFGKVPWFYFQVAWKSAPNTLDEFPIFPSTALQTILCWWMNLSRAQTYPLDIHQIIIHISESFASTYQITCNSSNIPSCPKSLPLNTWHYFWQKQQLYFCFSYLQELTLCLLATWAPPLGCQW